MDVPILVDPQTLWRLAVRHRVGIPVLAGLAKAVRPHDPDAADRLAMRATRRGMAALQKAERLATISAALSAAGIAHLAIKGPALAQRLHGDVAARDSKDLDLLVDPAAIEAVTPLLSRLGFEPAEDMSAERRPLEKDRPFVGDGIELEVHTRLLDVEALLPLPFDALWHRRSTIAIGAVAVPTLSDVDTLLYLCGHGSAHLWFRLKWLEDIARIFSNWNAATIEEARARARDAGAGAILAGAMDLVERVFGIVPAGVVRIASTRASRALVSLSLAALAAPAEHASSPSLGWILRRLPVQFGLATGWRYRSAFLRMLALAPHDFDATGLPKGFGWMRLPLRPVMLLRHRWTQSTLRR